MLLIRNLHSPWLMTVLATSRRALYTIAKNPTIATKQMPIEHILKICSTRKCSSAQDANFCSLMFDLMTKQGSINDKQHEAMQGEIVRILSNSLKYLHELSLAETLLLANNLFKLIETKRIKIRFDVLIKFVESSNRNVEKFIARDQEGKLAKQLITYVEGLMSLKKFSNQIKEIMDYLVKRAKSEEALIDMLKVLLRLKKKSNLLIYQPIEKLLQSHVAPVVPSLPLQSQLVGEIVLKLFMEFRLHLKEPYNCYPQWLLDLLIKMHKKYLQVQCNISSEEQLSFMKYYLRFMNETILISENALTVGHVRFVVQYLQKIESCFDYLEEAITGQQKVKLWLGFQSSLNEFVDQYTYLLQDADSYSQILSDNEWPSKTPIGSILLSGYKKIYKRLFQNAKIKDKSKSQRQQFCNLLSHFAFEYSVMLSRQRVSNPNKFTQENKFTHKLFTYFCNAYSTLLSDCSLKHKSDQPHALQYAVQVISILPYIAILYQKDINRNAKAIMQNTLKETLNFIYGLTDQNIIQYYQPSTNDSGDKAKSIKLSTRPLPHNPIDFVGTVNLVIKYLNFGEGQVVVSKQMQQSIDKINLTLQISTYVDSPLLKIKSESIDEPVMKRLSDMLKERFSSEQQKTIQNSTKSQPQLFQKSSQTHRHKSEYEQLLLNLLMLFKSNTMTKPSLCYSLYYQWFTVNKSLMLKIFTSASNQKFELSWELLRNSIRYLHSITGRSGIDFITEVLRICIQTKDNSSQNRKVDQQIEEIIMQKFKVIFNDRNSNNILYLKSDQIAQQKYVWLMTLLTDSMTMLKMEPIASEDPELPRQIMSMYKLIELLSFMAQDNRGSLYSRESYLSNEPMMTLSAWMTAIIQKIEFNKVKKYSGHRHQKARQNLICGRPIEQIIYYLTTANDPKYTTWVKYMDVSIVMQYLHDKYSKVQQYNLLLSFTDKNQSFDKSHDAFLNQELMNDKLLSTQASSAKSTVLKYYYYLMKSDRTSQSEAQSVQLVRNKLFMSEKQVVEYWLSNNIVSKTKQPLLLETMVNRLVTDKLQITYSQFTTIANNLIAALEQLAPHEYRRGNQKYEKLVEWVHTKMISFSQAQIQSFLTTYLKLLNYFPRIPTIHGNLTELITANLRNNNIEAVEQLYLAFSKYASAVIFPWEEFMSMMRRVRMRGLCYQYYGLHNNARFRVHVLMRAFTGLILLQAPSDISRSTTHTKQYQLFINRIRQYFDEVLAHIETTGIKQYLTKDTNIQILYECIIRHRIMTHLLKQVPKCALSALFEQLAIVHQPIMQHHIFRDQEKFYQCNQKSLEPHAFRQLGDTNLTLLTPINMSKSTATSPSTVHLTYLNSKRRSQSDSEVILETIYIKTLYNCSIQMLHPLH